MRKITVSRDDSVYEAWPDIAMLSNDRMVAVFTECTSHRNRELSRIVYKISDDHGETWSEKYYLTEQTTNAEYWNNAQIRTLSDGRLVIVCDKSTGERIGDIHPSYLWFSEDGIAWSEPTEIPIQGIVPEFRELQSGRWLVGAHELCAENNRLVQYLIYSDDKGQTWSPRITVAKDARFNLCEVSFLEVEPNIVVAYMRENSGRGYDCKKAISHDGGETWEGVYDVPLPGCHRPKAGFLKNGKILITYRFMQGGKGWLGSWTQNTFGALMNAESALATERNHQSARIFPIDFDRSTKSDIGYTGWVQLKNDDIYVVNYLVDDAPKAWIRASVISMNEIILEET